MQGPSGLSAAIRLKQLRSDLRVCVVEKGAEVGAHILSGCVLEPRALDELIPNWKEKNAPIKTKAEEDRFVYLSQSGNHLQFPLVPPQMHNEGNYVVSLSQVVRWLGTQAEEAGVEIYSGIAATEVLYNDKGEVQGIATGDVGISRSGQKKSSFARGMELRAPITVFSEGCRGSLTKTLLEKFQLNAESDPQTYGIGLKEVWEIKPDRFQSGLCIHTIGWPMDNNTYGGSFLYHFDNNKVSLGFVVGLDYENPYLNPYKEFQRWKTHPYIRQFLEGGTILQYGARAISEGGFQCLPKLIFPGGALIGDTAGTLITPKIKGTHTAMKSGMIVAEAIAAALKTPVAADATEVTPILLTGYPEAFSKSWVYQELKENRNIRPAFHYGGLLAGLTYGAIDTYVFRGKAPWTLRYVKKDNEYTQPASVSHEIEYPKPDGVLTFDLLTNLARSGTTHEHDQPIHLQLRDLSKAVDVNLSVFAGPEQRFCPAGVYEFVKDQNGSPALQRNAANCLHCKTCDIKDTTQNIDWVPPEGGGGPNYNIM